MTYINRIRIFSISAYITSSSFSIGHPSNVIWLLPLLLDVIEKSGDAFHSFMGLCRIPCEWWHAPTWWLRRDQCHTKTILPSPTPSTLVLDLFTRVVKYVTITSYQFVCWLLWIIPILTSKQVLSLGGHWLCFCYRPCRSMASVTLAIFNCHICI